MEQENPQSQPPPPTTLGGIVHTLGPATWLALASVFLPAAGSAVLLLRMNPIGQWLRSHEEAGLAGYIAGFAFLTGVAIIPTQITAILGGWAFGFTTGTICVLAGLTGSAMVGYCVARFGAASRVEKLFEQHPRWRLVRNALIGGSFLKTLAIIFLLRLPSTPYSVVNLVLGSTRANPLAYLIGTVAGMAPRMALFVYLASDVSKRLDPEKATEIPLPGWVFVASLVAGAVALLVVGVISRRALRHLTEPASTP